MNLEPRELQLLASENSCPGHLLLLQRLQSLIDDISDQMATAKSDEEERRATADWKALRRVQALFVNTTQLCLTEVQQSPSYNPELENLRIQQDPRLYQHPQMPYQTTGFPAQPYRPPQAPQVPHPGNQVYQQNQTHPTQPLPPYFQRPR